MVIVHLRGGLGNQMFQYAFYLHFRQQGLAAAIDLSHYKNPNTTTRYELERIFSIHARQAGLLEKASLKACWKLGHSLAGLPYKETDERFGYFDAKWLALRWGYLKGYWQSEQYCASAAAVLRTHFTFPALTGEKNWALLPFVQQASSVSIHIRRGDYLLDNRNAALPLDYYHRAIAHIQAKVANPVFVVFSDDAAWAAANLPLGQAHYVHWNTGAESYRDMQLMSLCAHNIIANSSFSWWAAWLNQHPQKIVIAPDRWLPGMPGTRDIVPTTWVKLSALVL